MLATNAHRRSRQLPKCHFAAHNVAVSVIAEWRYETRHKYEDVCYIEQQKPA
jgi:hypothetical protein